MIVLKKPIITEKTISDYQNNNVVRFEVDVNSNKFDAIKALENTYGVSVTSARVVNRLGKYGQDRFNRKVRKIVKKKADKKIMIFSLKKGDKIDIFNDSAK